MLLAVDVGNSEIKLGVFEGRDLCVSWRWATDTRKLADEYAAQLGWLLQSAGLPRERIDRIVLSSVVPQLGEVFEQLGESYFSAPPLRVSSAILTGIPLRVDKPEEVGADRIANAVATKTLYQTPAIVVDFGTATTFDVVSADGAFIGGCFAPGLQAAVDGLLDRAARLERFDLVAPPGGKSIGTNTIACLQAGTIYGYVGLVEGIVARIEHELSQKPLVIGTGGLVDIISAETSAIDIVDEHLTLHGLRVLADLNPAD